MQINKISLYNTRSYEKGELSPCANVNVIVGANAAGKTNLLEAIYFCALGHSPRTSQDKELLKWGSELARINVKLSTTYRKHEIDVYLNGKGEKKILIDGIGIERLSQLIGVLNVVYFSPDEMKLVKEQPKERRRFMDISLSSFSRSYLDILSKYNKILMQRNALLKDNFSDGLDVMLMPYDILLSKEGFLVQKERERFVKEINALAGEIHLKMTNEKEKLTISYEGEDAEDEQMLLERIQANSQKDIALRYTTVGVHRDDFSIKANGIDLRKFGSQGQQRTASLSLKLALIALNEQKTQETPVLLLDDVLSELDQNRREMLLTLASRSQTFITTTEWKENFDLGKANFYKIESGAIRRINV